MQLSFFCCLDLVKAAFTDVQTVILFLDKYVYIENFSMNHMIKYLPLQITKNQLKCD